MQLGGAGGIPSPTSSNTTRFGFLLLLDHAIVVHYGRLVLGSFFHQRSVYFPSPCSWLAWTALTKRVQRKGQCAILGIEFKGTGGSCFLFRASSCPVKCRTSQL